ncbi:MAG: hypothetical protein K8F91_04705 [Candidatus Obscuribacterales bacterium]|nr:hypothetical protein [Candidatus Obscuribacterales bacterium]
MLRNYALLAALSLPALAGCSRSTSVPSEMNFPDVLCKRVTLPPDSEGIEIQVRDYAPDTGKLLSRRTEFRNGETAVELYHDDGSLSEVEVDYPLSEDAEPGAKRQNKVTLLLDPTGQSVLFEKRCRPDGTAELVGHRRGDGNFESNDYYPDGKMVKARRVTDRERQPVEGDSYRVDGTREMSYKVDKKGWLETTEYRSDETRKLSTRRSRSPYDNVYRTLYGADGRSVEMEVMYTPYVIEAKYHRPDGTISQTRQYSSYGTVRISLHDEKGKPRLRQVWSSKPNDADWTEVDKDRQLTEVEELDENGKVTRKISFHKDGKTPKEVFIPESGHYLKGVHRYFREDGTLEKEEFKEDYRTSKDVKDFTIDDDIREEFPQEHLEWTEAEKPPLLSVMPVSPSGCEYCCGQGCEHCMD